MFLNRTASRILLALAAFSIQCNQTTPPASSQQVSVNAVPAPALAQLTTPRRGTSSANTAQAGQSSVVQAGGPKLEDVEERKGPFAIAGQTFTVVLHSKRLRGKGGSFEQALASLDLIDSHGVIQQHQEFPTTIENGAFEETCSATVEPILGSNGSGLLQDTGCEPSAPLSGGPWQIFGVINGRLSPIGKPLYAEGEMGDFLPGRISKVGSITQILPDELRIRLFTGYFFVSVPIRVSWMEGKLGLARHCFYQTGHGMAEGGCEMPVEGVERIPSQQELTFVRMFSESNDQVGIPEHVVVKKDSKVEILAGKVFVNWEESNTGINLGVGDDIWVKVRIDGREGWIHTDEDLQAIGLYRAG
jgi:hypothetical protein